MHAADNSSGTNAKLYRLPGIDREAIAQLSLVETALWPLNGTRRRSTEHRTTYTFGTGRELRQAQVTVRSALGLQPIDEYVLWGLLGASLDRRDDADGVLVAANYVRRIASDAEVLPIPRDFLKFSDEEIDALIGNTDLIIAAADKFAVAARVNELALRLSKPALWVGLYAAAGAGEIVFWHPGIDACFRCQCAKRYEAHDRARATGEQLNPTSDGCTIFDIVLLDSIAGQLAIGLLTRGSDNRHGRLIEALGDRNFLQVQINPDWKWGERRLVRELLGVPDRNTAFFSWCTIARHDPDCGQPPCPDCVQFRGRKATSIPEGCIP